MTANLKRLRELEKEGYIRVQTHPTLDLWIYNYTELCQFEKKWEDTTLQARGLILDADGNIVARGFDKFFNLGEAYVPETDPEQLETLIEKHGPFEIFEKYDGSLGIVFYYDSKWHIATRGSFASDQALKGATMLGDFNGDRTKTHLFEIIYPENRIVVNYGAVEELVYLGSRDVETGEYSLDTYCLQHFWPAAKYAEMKSEEENKEGYVLVFSDGYRVKVKHEEYKRLHKLVTGLNEKNVWEVISEGGSLVDILERVPDEFFKWAEKVASLLVTEYEIIEKQCEVDFYNITKELNGLTDRKEFALMANKCKYPQILYLMLDGRNYSSIIWKLVKPSGGTQFKTEV